MGESGGEQGLTDSSRWVGLRDASGTSLGTPAPPPPGICLLSQASALSPKHKKNCNTM